MRDGLRDVWEGRPVIRNTYPGRVVAGSGDTYEVAVYTRGFSHAHTRLQVLQLQDAPGEPIPEGTWALVWEAGGRWYMRVPV